MTGSSILIVICNGVNRVLKCIRLEPKRFQEFKEDLLYILIISDIYIFGRHREFYAHIYVRWSDYDVFCSTLAALSRQAVFITNYL